MYLPFNRWWTPIQLVKNICKTPPKTFRHHGDPTSFSTGLWFSSMDHGLLSWLKTWLSPDAADHVLQFFGDFKHDSPRFSELPAYPWPSLANQLTLRVSNIATTGKSTIELPMIFPANPATKTSSFLDVKGDFPAAHVWWHGRVNPFISYHFPIIVYWYPIVIQSYYIQPINFPILEYYSIIIIWAMF